VVVDLGCSRMRAAPCNTDTVPAARACAAVRVDGGQVCRVSGWEEGRIEDWGALEALLHEVLYGRPGAGKHGCGWREGEEGGVVFLEPNPLASSRGQRERTTQMLMEQFNTTSVVFADAPACALFAVGRTTGLVVDVGHTSTLVAAVVDGVMVPQLSVRIAGLGGCLMEAALAALNPVLAGSREDAREARAQAACAAESAAAFDVEREAGASASASVMVGIGAAGAADVSTPGEGEGPPGEGESAGSAGRAPARDVEVGFERFLCGELVLRPAEVLSCRGLEKLRASRMAQVAILAEQAAAQGDAAVGGVVATLARALQPGVDAWNPGVGPEQRRVMAEGVLVCGGAGGSIKGLAERIVAELKPLVPSDISSSLAVAPVPEYMVESVLSHASWTGAAILAKQAIPAGHGITRQEYDDLGPPAVHSKNYS